MSLHALPRHPNAMTISAFSSDGDMLATNSYYSVGGGFVESDATQCKSRIYRLALVNVADATMHIIAHRFGEVASCNAIRH